MAYVQQDLGLEEDLGVLRSAALDAPKLSAAIQTDAAAAAPFGINPNLLVAGAAAVGLGVVAFVIIRRRNKRK